MKILDVRLRPPFEPYLGKGNAFDMDSENPFGIKHFYKNFGMKLSDSMKEASMEKMFEEMDRCGEMKGVVPIRKTHKGLQNEYLRPLLEKYPERFYGACGLSVTDASEAIETLKEYVVSGLCIAAFMEPGFHGVMMDDKKLYPVYQFAQEEHIPLLISFGGFHGPSSEYCNAVHAGHVASDFPELKMCLCHGGWPWVEAAVHLAFFAPNVYLSPDIYALHVAGAQSYIEAANYMLRKKFIYGSAYPCVDIETSVSTYLERLRPEVAEDVMYYNAARFLGLEE